MSTSIKKFLSESLDKYVCITHIIRDNLVLIIRLEEKIFEVYIIKTNKMVIQNFINEALYNNKNK